ncbi:hypothetical protein [Streptomyces alkaliterrae]|uniref:ABM domain-containing protein n=1 Tax=Streptomyces alkaliterrae TaxID=2213162 RepID=A0A5P0Z016_9ACTN|nr:hypothetical protein [Streptomyces alkaliterrae]MBB1256123.1 hypothetical protein [Streptomyces alkaliterrae]MBB1261762.1 hypothetical protein [Streptomyces alkaliterrae]MQS04589.1 hypothetical protein [Streptomyces alkaliterrae]
MSATIEYVRFETDDPAELSAHRDQLVDLLRERYRDDFLGAHLGRYEDGSMIDLIVWASPEAAQRAAREMPSDPAAGGFFSRIGTVHEMRHAEVLHTA